MSSAKNDSFDQEPETETPVEQGVGETSSSENSQQEYSEIEAKNNLIRIQLLETKLKDYEAKFSDLRVFVKKMEDEISQIRSRSERETEKNVRQQILNFLTVLLPVIDNFERSLKVASQEEGPLAEGVRMIYQQFQDFLKRFEVSRIVTKGSEFNPEVHEAIVSQPVEASLDGKIVDEINSGYLFKETVLRPAQVIVGKAL